MLAEVTYSKKRVIVATSALRMGVNIPGVLYIVHVDWPFSMLNYAQGSGTAG
jgi:superfamily II DNA helicase RecQ